MSGTPAYSRRVFLARFGHGSVAAALLVAGCGPAASTSPVGTAVPTTVPPTVPPGTSPGSLPATSGFDWQRVDLGFVSAYVLARDGEAVVVDSGPSGSADDIEVALGAIDLAWDAVGHVIFTHLHGDHVGSAADVMSRAARATGYAGAADLAAIAVPRPLTAVADNDRVFDLRIVTTPGHTAGHIAVLDEVGGILVAGDALGTVGGTLAGSNPQFTADMAAAARSVAKLATLRVDIRLVGHGDPIESGAAGQVAALAASS
jgi:glyoxylase-like metal-dependent hydrolase (beta-lactamase superfamily II)